MITYLIMGVLSVFLLCDLVLGAKYETDSKHFFDKENSNAMRGFWCVVVVLVHIPLAYQNRIQDMLGSFAYIGVTFFFMTSAYGLSLSIKKNPDSIITFWRRRLPKLIVPCLITNLVGFVLSLIENKPTSVLSFLYINAWVCWLLVCYLIFWMCNSFFGGGAQDILTCIFVIVFSLTVYILKNNGFIEKTTWCPEIFGFIWGIILSKYKNRFLTFAKSKWYGKCAVAFFAAMILGIAYLKFKCVPFLGDYLLKIVLGLAIIAFMLFVNTQISIGNRVSAFLGKISFEIYLIHGLSFGLISYMCPSINSGIFIMASLCLTVLVSCVVQWVSGKILAATKTN